jgi:flagellar hook-basal body complex protein FliE
MSDPIGAAASRALQGINTWATPAGQDGAARTLPLVQSPQASEPFGDTLTRAINGVSEKQDNAATTLQSFLRGDDVELHRVMAATEEAQISLEMLIEVRNKFAEAYRTLTTMQG